VVLAAALDAVALGEADALALALAEAVAVAAPAAPVLGDAGAADILEPVSLRCPSTLA
jgi:hypothetical protein